MNIALILAGGVGSRAGGSLPKQFQYIRGKRMLWWSVEQFLRFDPDCLILLVVHPHFLENWEREFGEEEKLIGHPVHKTAGGSTRVESVRNGLNFLENLGVDGAAKVFIHDGARPLVTEEMIRAGEAVAADGIGAVPVVPLSDSIREFRDGRSVAVDRNNYRAVQTPQIFLFQDIKAAYDAVSSEDGSLTDDASVAERFGLKISTFPGDPRNIKVTNPIDFIIAENCGL